MTGRPAGVGYPVPAESVEREWVVRRSRFVARCEPVTTRAAALEAVEHCRERHPDARHHCWGYRVGDPAGGGSAGSDDDGEPGGTAGRPILNVIGHKGLSDLVVVVTRYFGGVKLGAGGLIRAYAAATEQALANAVVETRRPRWTVSLDLDFAAEQPLRHWVSSRDAALDEVAYGEGFRATLRLGPEAIEELRAFTAAPGGTLHE